VDSKLDSRSKSRGFKSHKMKVVLNSTQPWFIQTDKKENMGGKMGQTKKVFRNWPHDKTYSWLKVWLTGDRLFVAIPWWGCCCGIGRMCTMHGDCCCCCCCKGRIWTRHDGFWLWLSCCCCCCECGTSRTCVPKLLGTVGSMTGPSGRRWIGVMTSPWIEDFKVIKSFMSSLGNELMCYLV